MVASVACSVNMAGVVATKSTSALALGPPVTEAVTLAGPALAERMVTVARPPEVVAVEADRVPRVEEKFTVWPSATGFPPWLQSTVAVWSWLIARSVLARVRLNWSEDTSTVY